MPRPSLPALLLVLGALSAFAETKPAISPTIDVASPLPTTQISGVSPALSQESFTPGDYEAQFGYQVPNGPLRFNLSLSEFARLREAAHMAGGDVEITVRPVGFKMANYIVPLQRVGFDVRVTPGGEVVVSSSREMETMELRRAALQKEVNDLRETRRRLLSDIKSLQACMNSASFSQGLADTKTDPSLPPLELPLNNPQKLSKTLSKTP
ncbi:MAG: hypothetical protein PW734_01245 [Verrucomicrobium sp.]|nr:hypothetical protein [Verrucomicrobium sp.]